MGSSADWVQPMDTSQPPSNVQESLFTGPEELPLKDDTFDCLGEPVFGSDQKSEARLDSNYEEGEMYSDNSDKNGEE